MPQSGPSRPTICLNMIVRNEAHVIAQALESVSALIDTWVIVDTGSTDGTPDLIEKWFADHGVEGHLHHRPWRDFGTNRTEALHLCRGVADYAFVMDADDVLIGVPDLTELSLDAYLLRFGTDFVYWRRQLFSTRVAWRYEGVIHEYAVCDEPVREARIEGQYLIDSRRLGDRSRNPDKYRRDAELLADIVRREPQNARAAFYLAQSLIDSGNLVDALHWYTRRSLMGGWDEEVFVSHLRRAECMERLGVQWAERIDALLSAWEVCPWRAESLHRLARMHRAEGKYRIGHQFARLASTIPFPEQALLFVDRSVYDWRIADELSICAFYIGNHEESFSAASSILDCEDLEEPDRERILGNRDFNVPFLLERTGAYDADLVRSIAARAAGGDVTLTVTTCRRPELFEKTMNSFIRCVTDHDRIARWICVDDGSSPDDLRRMESLYPFLEIIAKPRAAKGHANSMNAILDLVGTPLWLHLEDDWQFFAPGDWIGRGAAVLDDSAEIGQVLFNRNYAETPGCRRIAGGVVQRTARERIRYRLHQHAEPGTSEYEEILGSLPGDRPTVAYWPHFSLRPSLMRTGRVKQAGRFDPGASHFELDFAKRYTAAGLRSAFLDTVIAQHIGRLTWEPPASRQNAYDLNGESQFGKPPAAAPPSVRVINLARRPDRLSAFMERLTAADAGLADRVERFDAVDGRDLVLTDAIRTRYRGNDFGWNRAVIGCAESHLALWREAAGGSGSMLIFEDDVFLDEAVVPALDALDLARHDFDLCFLGIVASGSHGAGSEGRRLGPVPWSDYVGGLFAYVVTAQGAQKLLELAARDGIRCGIDRFVHTHASELNVLAVTPPLARAELAHWGNQVDSDIQRETASLLSVPKGRRTRVKLMGNWAPALEICHDWNRMSQGDLRWNDLEVTWTDDDIDYFVVLNHPRPGERFIPERTIVLQLEPWCGGEDQSWGVKTWGEWARPDPRRFLQVRSHDRFLNTAFWQMQATFGELSSAVIEKSRGIATICSGKYFDPGHRKRVDFLHFLDEKDDDVVRVDVYGYENPHGFRSYVGPHPPGRKDAALFPYRYFFAAENNREHNFITEKLWEPLLAEALCFYWGAPNAAQWVDPDAFIPIDLDDFEAAFETMKRAVQADEWSRRVHAIRTERVKVLEHLQFFPMLETALSELMAPVHPDAGFLEYRRLFQGFPTRDLRSVCFVHSYTRGGDTRILTEILERIAAGDLRAELDAVVVVNVGDPIELPRVEGLPLRTTLVNEPNGGDAYEFPTLRAVHRFSSFHPEARVLYVHTKGASHPAGHESVHDWRRYMLYEVVDRFRDGLAALEQHDVAGCDYREWPAPHFSGNFWWARASYLARLQPPVPRDRHEAERWVLSGGGRWFELHDSGRNHYWQRHPEEEYIRE